MSKYRALGDHLQSIEADVVTLSFSEIESILGNHLPASARQYPEWWANSQTTAHPWSHIWMEAGWESHGVSLSGERVNFQRVKTAPSPKMNTVPISAHQKSIRSQDFALDIQSIALKLNQLSAKYEIGELQDLRKTLKQFARRPGNNIFTAQTIQEEWAFHHGGRSELQFNIGKEGANRDSLRHGIAFSFETSQSLPSIDPLIPKVRLFNEYLQLYPEQYADMRMWHYHRNSRSSDYMPSPIPSERVVENTFVFLGTMHPQYEIDYHQILSDFDRLLPLYRYVESDGTTDPTSELKESPFNFVSGCSSKKIRTASTLSGDVIDVTLRHNALQTALYSKLVSKFGETNVGSELSSGISNRVDIVVRRENRFWFYEIKTAHSPRACIREAIGQLLEYSYWPKAQEAERLYVVGENPLDEDAKLYLSYLRKTLAIPISYEHISLVK